MVSSFYKNNLHFVADRYEEWESGMCISKDRINVDIQAEVSDRTIKFILMGAERLRIVPQFYFYFSNADILSDRIQYQNQTTLSKNHNGDIPSICHLFIKNETIDYIRFAILGESGFRLVEFYGSLVELGSRVQLKSSGTSADNIIRELERFNMLGVHNILERACEIYNTHSGVRTKDYALCILEALKLFVKANKLEDDACELEGRKSMVKPKILMFIALCNYKINNINTAYHTAKKGYYLIDEIIENNTTFIGLSKSMFGGDTLNELISVIEKKYPEEIHGDEFYDCDENIIDTFSLESIIGEI